MLYNCKHHLSLYHIPYVNIGLFLLYTLEDSENKTRQKNIGQYGQDHKTSLSTSSSESGPETMEPVKPKPQLCL